MNFEIVLLNIFAGIPCFWLWIIFSLLAFLLGWLLHALLFSKQGLIRKLRAERDQLDVKTKELEKEVSTFDYKIEQSEETIRSLKADIYKIESDKIVWMTKYNKLKDEVEELQNSTATARSAVGVAATPLSLNYNAIFSPENLQIVEGIGPKIEGLLKAAGITNWTLLAAASYDRLKEILAEAGPQYRMHDPKTWSEQAKLAAEENWNRLVEYQKFLDTGRENEGSLANASKAEKMAMKILGFSNNPEDLKVVEGIGPKIEELLKNAGINSWSELAATSVDKLQEILKNAGESFRLADPSTWPKQADLAVQGNWSELSEYQDFLDGGKDPGK